MRQVGPTAALAGLPTGVQCQGPWAGRRQLFVRFADEAETAVMYTPDALVHEIDRIAARAALHSMSICGRDPLGSTDFLGAVLTRRERRLPVMVDIDGQRPEALDSLINYLDLVQVTLDLAVAGGWVERALQSLAVAARCDRAHALVLAPAATASDGELLRIVEQAHGVSAGTIIVMHPTADEAAAGDRWASLLDRATALHADVRLALRLPRPLGMR